MASLAGFGPNDARDDAEFYGRLIQSCVGAHLINSVRSLSMGLYYWAGNNCEVYFVLVKGSRAIAIEVKSGRKPEGFPGVEVLYRALLVGTGGIPIDEFLLSPVQEWFR